MLLNNIEFFLDRCSVKSLPIQIQNFIIDNQLVSSRENQYVSFCGIILLEGKKYVFFPRSVDIKIINSDQYKHAKLLVSTLYRYFNQTKNTVFHPDDEFQPNDMLGLDQLDIRRKILTDYLENGLFFSKQDTLRKNIGKADWNITLKRGFAFPDKDNSPIYLDYYSKNIHDFHDEVTKIHVGILQQIFEDNLFFDPKFKKIPYSVKYANASKLNIISQVKILKSELKNQYKNRSMRLIKLLIDFLKNYCTTTRKSTVIGITKFHFAWEHMLAETQSNTVNLNHLLPKPMYIAIDKMKKPEIKGSMRTDICVVDESTKTVTIIDAKYYQATSPENSPGWGDLVKQFFYEKALKTLPQYSEYTIKNIMIFPGSVQSFEKVRMASMFRPIPKLSQYIFNEMLSFTWRETFFKKFTTNLDYVQFLDKDFPPLECKYIAPLKLMDLYINHQKTDFIHI